MSADDAARREFFARLDALPEELGEVVARIKSHGEPRRCWFGPDDYSVGADWRRHIVSLTQAGKVWEARKEGPSKRRGPKAGPTITVQFIRDTLDFFPLVAKQSLKLAMKLESDRLKAAIVYLDAARRAREAQDGHWRTRARRDRRDAWRSLRQIWRKRVSIREAVELATETDAARERARKNCFGAVVQPNGFGRRRSGQK